MLCASQSVVTIPLTDIPNIYQKLYIFKIALIPQQDLHHLLSRAISDSFSLSELSIIPQPQFENVISFYESVLVKAQILSISLVPF